MAGLGLAAASLPGWLQSCTGGVGTGEEGPLEGEPKSGAEALALAKRNGRPLLVFVVPDGALPRWVRGAVLGVFINRTSAEGMADLALCGIWCATPAEIRAELAPNADVNDAAIAVLIETDSGKSSVVAGDPSLEENIRGIPDDPADERSVLRTEMLRKKLHAAIAPDKDTLHRRADLARKMFLPRAGRYPLGAMGDGDEPNASHVKHVPAWVLWRAENADESTRVKWMAMLSDDSVRRLRNSPVPRAHWAHSLGCGTTYEDKVDPWGSQVSCGMGRISEYSSRFLSFYSEDE